MLRVTTRDSQTRLQICVPGDDTWADLAIRNAVVGLSFIHGLDFCKDCPRGDFPWLMRVSRTDMRSGR